MQLDPQAFLAEIAEAFAGVTLGIGISLYEAEELDNHGSPEELRQARALDTDTRWQDVRDEWLEGCSNAYWYLDVEGMRYYLPTVMSWSLRPHRKLEHEDPEECVAERLLDRSVGTPLQFILSARQRRVTARWLRHHASTIPYQTERQIERVLASDWGRYLEENNE